MDTVPEFLLARYENPAGVAEPCYELAAALSEEFALLANVLEQTLPPSREKSMAQTSLQQAYWAAQESLRLNPDEPPSPMS